MRPMFSKKLHMEEEKEEGAERKGSVLGERHRGVRGGRGEEKKRMRI